MSPGRILAIARRIAQGFRRDERTLGLMFVVPLVVTALLGWVLNEQVDEVVDVAIVNEAGQVGDRIVTAMMSAAAAPDSDISVPAVLGVGGTLEAELQPIPLAAAGSYRWCAAGQRRCSTRPPAWSRVTCGPGRRT